MSWNRSILFLILAAFPVFAQDTPLDILEKEMDELARQTKGELIERIQKLKQENQRLKLQISQFSPSDVGSDYEYQALERENQQLKKALRALARGNASEMEQSYTELVDSPIQPAEPVTTNSSVPGLEYEIVKEWGRSPEDAARLPKRPPSMKGMAIHLKGELADENSHTYVWFGSAMKQLVVGYDIVTIECFKTRAAAAHFAETGEIIHSSRVLSMTRREGSSEDTIIGFGSKGKFVVKNPV
jgi:hypothetical protein